MTPGEESGPPEEDDDGFGPDGLPIFHGEVARLQHRLFGDYPIHFDLFTSVDAFKGPLDEFNGNGNFGFDLGGNVGIPVSQRLGIGIQLGSRVVMSDLSGTPWTDEQMRTQDFTTIGVFQRLQCCERSFSYGFVYDWLFDNYDAKMRFGQWRIKAAWSRNPWNEVGIWAAIREHGSIGSPPDFGSLATFRPSNQGNLYWKHTWCNEASLTGRIGVAEATNSVILGADARLPLNPRWAVTGGFTYAMPPTTRPAWARRPRAGT